MALSTQSISDRVKADETEKDYIIVTDERGYKSVKKIRGKVAKDIPAPIATNIEELKPQPIKKSKKKVKE